MTDGRVWGMRWDWRGFGLKVKHRYGLPTPSVSRSDAADGESLAADGERASHGKRVGDAGGQDGAVEFQGAVVLVRSDPEPACLAQEPPDDVALRGAAGRHERS